MSITFATFETAARSGQIGACRAFLETFEAEQGRSGQYLHALAILHSRMGDFARALEVCEEIGLRWPQYPNHRYLLAACAAHLGRVAPVLQTAVRLAGYRQDYWEALQLRAEMWHLVGRDELLAQTDTAAQPPNHSAAVARFLRGESLMRLFGIAAGFQEYAQAWCSIDALVL